jgi:hypothetical protein
LVWRITDTAPAIFDVDNFAEFVVAQVEIAVAMLHRQQAAAGTARGKAEASRSGKEAVLRQPDAAGHDDR